MSEQKFTFGDIRAGKSIRLYAQSMFKHAKAAEMTSTYNQLLTVWNGLDVQLRVHVPMPTPATSMSAFLQELDAKGPIFNEMAQRYSGNRATKAQH
ncbi:hypothetical protein B7463_g6527, partial [Scytalidium lignicola]